MKKLLEFLVKKFLLNQEMLERRHAPTVAIFGSQLFWVRLNS